MTTTIDLNEERLQAFLDRAFADLAASYGGVMVSLGDRLGLYRALAGAGPLSVRRAGRAHGLCRAPRPRMAGQPGRGRLRRLRPRGRDLRAAARARGGARRPRQPDADHARVQRPGFDVDGRGAGREGVPQRRGALGLTTNGSSAGWRPSSRTPTAVCWCCSGYPPRRGRRAPRAGSEGCRHRLRPRPLHGADGGGLPELHVPRHRRSRGLDCRAIDHAATAGVSDRVSFEVGTAMDHRGVTST